MAEIIENPGLPQNEAPEDAPQTNCEAEELPQAAAADGTASGEVRSIPPEVAAASAKTGRNGFVMIFGKKLAARLAGLIVLILVVVLLLVFKDELGLFGKKDRLTTVTASSLEKILEVSQLSAMDYTYNGVAKVRDAEGTPIYYIAYEGTVKVGIDFSAIDFTVDEESRQIKVWLPKLEIQEISVNAGTMEYIFTKKKYNTADIAPEAFDACTRELRESAEVDRMLFTMADENVRSQIEALFAPWAKQMEPAYTVIIEQGVLE